MHVSLHDNLAIYAKFRVQRCLILLIDDSKNNPCSDGVGRTGTFICIHSQLERLKTEGVVDFFQAAKSARIQRAGLIPDDV